MRGESIPLAWRRFVPHTLGALVWDQAERDVKCPVATAAYGCMQRLLLSTWRSAFASPRLAFVAVQVRTSTRILGGSTRAHQHQDTGG